MTSPLSINSISNSFYSSGKTPEMPSGSSHKTERETDYFPIQAQKKRRIEPQSNCLEISSQTIDRTAQTSFNTISLSLASRCPSPYVVTGNRNQLGHLKSHTTYIPCYNYSDLESSQLQSIDSPLKDQMSSDLVNKEKSAIDFLSNASKKIAPQQQNVSSTSVERSYSPSIQYSQTIKFVTPTYNNRIPIEIFNHKKAPYLHTITPSNTFTRVQFDGRKWIYQGTFKGERFNGHGILKMQYPNGKLDFIYQGQFYAGFFEGIGELQYGQGTTYKGHFSNGRFHGKGTLWNNLSFYRGEFQNNLYHGQGALTIQGDHYIGQFRGGSLHGDGTLRYRTGYTYTGLFAYCFFEGQGKITRPDGSILYKGTFHKNKFHGAGTFNDLAGNCYTGIFLQGFLYEGTLKIKKTDGTIEEITVKKGSS